MAIGVKSYGLLTTTAGSVVVTRVSGVFAMVNDQVRLAVWTGVEESVTVQVMGSVPELTGVPLMMPVDGSIVRFRGKPGQDQL